MLIDSHLLQKSFVFKIRKILREKKMIFVVPSNF